MTRVRETLRSSAPWLVPLLAVATAVNAVGLARAPQRVDDEGTYVAQAFAVERYGELAHYTYWYDHPPLGWLQIAAWTTLTRGFDRWPLAVIAGREFMIVVHLASVVLLWFLVRRLLDSPVAASIAAAIFTLSPLCVMFHRAVYLDNIATAWFLAACLLATARRHQLLAHAGAGLCAGIAVLTKETFLLLVVPVAWEMLRNADPLTRRYTLRLAGGTLVLCGTAFLAFAVLKGELFPGAGVSLTEAIRFQLVDRQGSGSILTTGSTANDTVRIWLGSDPILLPAGLAASVIGLGLRAIRPYAAAYLLLGAAMLRAGYLPVPYAVGTLPLAALVITGVGVATARRLAAYDVDLAAYVTTLALTLSAIAVVPVWSSGLHAAVANDADRPLRDAEQWMEAHVPRKDRLLVDDAVWVDLVRAGFPRDHVVWHYKPDTDPEVSREAPDGWRSYGWLLVTETVRQSAPDYPTVASALKHSTTVAAYGEGRDQVLVRRITTTQEVPEDAHQDPRPSSAGDHGAGRGSSGADRAP
jgi:hypothetical protein